MMASQPVALTCASTISTTENEEDTCTRITDSHFTEVAVQLLQKCDTPGLVLP